MHCENCGANIDESKDLPKFCPDCGAQIVKNGDETVSAVDGQRLIIINNVTEVKTPTNSYAIVALIMSIMPLLSLFGLIFGIIGLRNSAKINSGRGLSIAAITISSIWIVFLFVEVVIIAALA